MFLGRVERRPKSHSSPQTHIPTHTIKYTHRHSLPTNPSPRVDAVGKMFDTTRGKLISRKTAFTRTERHKRTDETMALRTEQPSSRARKDSFHTHQATTQFQHLALLAGNCGLCCYVWMKQDKRIFVSNIFLIFVDNVLVSMSFRL